MNGVIKKVQVVNAVVGQREDTPKRGLSTPSPSKTGYPKGAAQQLWVVDYHVLQ